jgi:hypothetical protein
MMETGAAGQRQVSWQGGRGGQQFSLLTSGSGSSFQCVVFWE